MDKQDFHFEFVVENVTRQDAEKLLDLILGFAEQLDTVVGGGFNVLEGDGDGEQGEDGS